MSFDGQAVQLAGPEPRQQEPDTKYEDNIRNLQAQLQRTETGKIVIRAADQPWIQNRQAHVKRFLHPTITDTACSYMRLFVNQVRDHGGTHRHQGGLTIFVLDGKGYSVVDGERVDWEGGDLLLLPIKPGGVDHQHFNLNPSQPVHWIPFIIEPFHSFLADELVQITPHPDWLDAGKVEIADVKPRDKSQLGRPHVKPITSGEGEYGDSLLDDLFRRRDAYRQQAAQGLLNVRGKDLSWETNRQGKMKWYMHPAKMDACLRTLLVWVQEIPPGSRSGRQLHPGGLVHYILEGRGYTRIDGVEHAWQAGDVVAFPYRHDGLDYQHFNSDPSQPARFVCGVVNLFDVLGWDMGSRFEQIENAPEFGRA